MSRSAPEVTVKERRRIRLDSIPALSFLAAVIAAAAYALKTHALGPGVDETGWLFIRLVVCLAGFVLFIGGKVIGRLLER